MELGELAVGAILGAVAAVGLEAVTGGVPRLWLYRLFRAVRWGPAPHLDLRAIPPDPDEKVTWLHVEVANDSLRFPLTNEAERVRAHGTLDRKTALTFMWDGLGGPTQFAELARHDWATIPVALRAKMNINDVYGNRLDPGVSCLTDTSFLVHQRPIVLSPGEHYLEISVRPRADDAVVRYFRLDVPEAKDQVADLVLTEITRAAP